MKKILVYTLHKAASMFIYRLNEEIAEQTGVSTCSINNANQQKDIVKNGWKSVFDDYGHCAIFSPIRIGEAQPNIPDNPDEHVIIIHSRDPRDVMTSMFFSSAYSHPTSKRGFNAGQEQRQQWIDEGIDKFVLKSLPGWKNRYDQLLQLVHSQPHCNLVKYEDMVLRFDLWLMQYLMGFKHLVPAENIRPLFTHCLDKFRSEFVILPEDVYRHKRKMVPGDHKEKLAPETIAIIKEAFGPTLENLGYC